MQSIAHKTGFKRLRFCEKCAFERGCLPCRSDQLTFNKPHMIKLVRSVRLAAILVVMLLLQAPTLLAQTRSVSGVVKSEGETLPGVTVSEKGTNNGTVTDADGKFTLSVSGESSVLVVSFIGMQTQEVPVGSRTSFEIELVADVTELQEVVVIGYGTVERRNLTSAVSSVDDKQLKDIPINSAAQALAGRLAGVQVITSEGSPDADVQVRVRGGMSITGDNSPLYIVDGVQVENALSVISPQDIESINVLKDASVTAIYGSRGANGVVVITTKGGNKGKTSINFNSFVGVRQLGKKLDVWKPYDFVQYQYERSRGSDQTEEAFLETYGTFDDIELYQGVPLTDWQEEVFGRNAIQQTHNLGINGGNEKTSFNLSLTSNKEEGVMMGSDFDRKLINFKFDHKVTDKLGVAFNVRYNHTEINGSGTATEGSSSLNRLRHSVKYRPYLVPGQTIETYDPDYAAETNANSLALINPVLLTQQDYRQNIRQTANFNGSVSYKLTDYLTFKTTVGVDMYEDTGYIFNDTITSASRANGQGLPIATIDADRRTTLNNSNVLTFSGKKFLPEQHDLEFVLGHEVLQIVNKTNFQENKLFPIGITPELAFGSMQLGTPQPTSYTRETESRLLSYFGRLRYDLNDKYFVTLSLRADGSSKFADGKRWGYFPAASLMWRVSSESFMDGLSGVIDDLKFRGSYGESGNNRIPDYLYLSVFNPDQYYAINNQQVLGFGPASLVNSNLKWESTVARNIGVDFGLFNSRLQVSVDLYSNKSKDLLLNQRVSPTSGYTDQYQNVGETLNKGIEIQLGATPVHRGDFRWDANFNIAFNRNEIVSLGDQESFLQSSNWAGSNQPADYNVIVGRSVGTIWGLVTDGYYSIDDFDYESGAGTYTLKAGVASNKPITSIDPYPGVIKFKDVDGNGVVDDNDRTVIGTAQPKFYGGLNQNFTYKNFDLSIFLNFQYGNDVLNANKLEFSSGYTVNSNLLTTMDGRWRNVNDAGEVVTDPAALAALNQNATIWSPLTTASSFYVHSWAVEDGSFIRINNITLGYSLPGSVLSRLRISKFRIYGTVNNIATITNYTGYDPEANTRRNSPLTPGVDYAAYPRSKAYIVGVNLTF